MKIAACFAGQPRFINECAPSILENVFKDQDVDVFAHLWFGEDLTSNEADAFKYGGAGGWESYRIPDTAIDDFVKYYNPIELKTEPSVHFYDKYMEDGYEIPLHKYWPGSIGEPNHMERQIDRTLSNFFSQSEVNRMKLIHEYKNNFKYDWVFKFRPDVQVHTRIDLENYTPHSFNCMYHTSGFPSHINDWFGFAGSDIMDVFMGVFPMFQRVFDLTKYHHEGAWDNETLHAQILDQLNIEVARHPFHLTVPRL